MTGPIRVLIADNDETFLHSTADLLRQAGYNCECAPDGIAARELAGRFRPDVLVADINMPGNGQLELVESLREHDLEIPVVLVTGYPSLNSAVRSIRLPVTDYLVKPVEFDELRSCIDLAAQRTRSLSTVRSLQGQLAQWRSELKAIEAQAVHALSGTSPAPSDELLQLTLGKILEVLFTGTSIKCDERASKQRKDYSVVIRSEREQTLLAALRDTAKVLENTKRSFRSKELAALRRNIVDLLDGTDWHGPGDSSGRQRSPRS